MIIIIILTLSILLQFVAAFMAFRLIPVTGKKLAWSFISVALMLMAITRCIPLIRLLSGNIMIHPDFNAELLALVISIMMVAGIIRVASIFKERMRVEEEAIHAAREWQTTFDAANDSIWILDQDQRILRTNKASERIFNQPCRDFIGKYCWEILHVTTHPISECPLLRAQKTLKRETMELRIGGGWFQVTVDPILDVDGRYTGAVHFISNITDRKQIEEALKQSGIFLNKIIEESPNPMWISDENGTLIRINQACCNLLNIKSEEVVGKYNVLYDSIVEEQGLLPLVKSVFAEGRTVRFDITYKTSLLKHPVLQREAFVILDVTISPVIDSSGKITNAVIQQTDITKRKQAEEALRISEENYRSLIENQTELVCRFRPDGTFIFVNEEYCRFFGKTKDELIGKEWFPLPIEEDLKEIKEKMMSLSLENPIVTFENRAISYDGNIHWIQFVDKGSFDINGNLLEIHSVGRDITKLKRAEEQIEILARLSFESPDPILRIHRDGTLLFVNRAGIKQLSEWNLQVGKSLPAKIRDTVSETLKTGSVRLINFEHGKRMYMFSVAPNADAGYANLYGRDVTDLKKMEDELLNVQKLESLGILAGGIAHNFNNILTSISGNISLAKMKIKTGNKIYDLLSAAETASERSKELARQLLTFAKGGTPIKETASIQNLIKESSLFAIHGSKSGCEFYIAEDLWPVEADMGQINQAISNVLINSNQAMPDGGTIRITACNMMPENMNNIPVTTGKYILISIKDEGVGIAEKDLIKIFDPYFTTRQAGSGLGLATAYSIIKKHNGHISVDSVSGAGTTVDIYLPASVNNISEKEEAVLLMGRGKILVMDDDMLLKEMVKEMLYMLGYESEYAKDGVEAVEMYREAVKSKKPYDAVILDVTIPGGMGGKETIKRLLEIDPQVKAIVFSGYSDDEVLSNFSAYGFKGMMQKPFDAYELGKALKDVLKGNM